MKALILAAGVGSRLKEKTIDMPKCLVNINGKPILEHQLNSLLANEIKDIVIVIGYKGDKIKEFISTHSIFKDLDITFVENHDYATTNSSYSFWLARNHIKDSQYLHFNCDIVFDPKLLTKLINYPGENVLLVDRKVQLDESMEQVLLDDDRIIFMDKANITNAAGRGSGMAKLSPTAISLMLANVHGHITAGNKNQHCHGLMRYALQEVPFHALDPEGIFFKEINNQEELQIAEDGMRRWLEE